MNSNRPFLRGRLLERQVLYSGRIVQLEVDRIDINGGEHLREVVRHPGGVVVLGVLDNGNIPFVRQHRYPADRDLLELPAGKIDSGEEPQVSAAREMEEETGYRPVQMEHVMSFYSTPGFCDELLHLYYAPQLVASSRNLESDEDIETELYSLDEALQMSREGRISDGKTLAALFWLFWKRNAHA